MALFHYNPETGVFTRMGDSRGRGKKFERAGSISSAREGKMKYRQIYIDYKPYREHRLAWFYMTGHWPSGEIDHINGNGLDNRFSNLRNVSQQENAKNRRMPSNNTSGCMGVYWDENNNSWYAEIYDNRKRVRLGFFKTFFDACSARKSAERKYNYHQNHGRRGT